MVHRTGPRGRGRRRARPRPSAKVQAAAPLHLGARELGRERTRWFPALVSNHVVDLVNKYPREQLPELLTGYITDRTGYDYQHHAEVGSSNAGFVGDEVTDRFCVLGEVDEVVEELSRPRGRRRRPAQRRPHATATSASSSSELAARHPAARRRAAA